MWSINLNWLSLAEMIERKSYYIYIIFILYIYNKILSYHFPPLFCFTDHVTTLTTPWQLACVFCGAIMVDEGIGWLVFSPCKSLCCTKNCSPFGASIQGRIVGAGPLGPLLGLCLFVDGGGRGKPRNVYKVYTKTTEITVMCGFYAFVYRNVGHRKLLIPKYCSSFATLTTEMSYKQIF